MSELAAMSTGACYPGGRPYFGLHSAAAGDRRPRGCRQDQVITLTSTDLGWPRFWEIISAQLAKHSYTAATQDLYRSVLRGFYRRVRCAPALITTDLIRNHLNSLV